MPEVLIQHSNGAVLAKAIIMDESGLEERICAHMEIMAEEMDTDDLEICIKRRFKIKLE